MPLPCHMYQRQAGGPGVLKTSGTKCTLVELPQVTTKASWLCFLSPHRSHFAEKHWRLPHCSLPASTPPASCLARHPVCKPVVMAVVMGVGWSLDMWFKGTQMAVSLMLASVSGSDLKVKNWPNVPLKCWGKGSAVWRGEGDGGRGSTTHESRTCWWRGSPRTCWWRGSTPGWARPRRPHCWRRRIKTSFWLQSLVMSNISVFLYLLVLTKTSFSMTNIKMCRYESHRQANLCSRGTRSWRRGTEQLLSSANKNWRWDLLWQTFWKKLKTLPG